MIKDYEQLYKKDNKGLTRVWWVSQNSERYCINHGVSGGEIQTTNWNTAVGKNIGRSNETTAEEQASKEVLALYKQQLESGYTADINALGGRIKQFFDPMLCARWNDKVEADISNAVKTSIYKLYSQPKLDGIRCLAKRDGLWSRGGKRIHSCPHIEAELKPVFERAPKLILDGELYNHDFKDDFNSLTSFIKKEKLSDSEILRNKEIVQYHIYDTPSIDGGFGDRFSALYGGFKDKQSIYPSIRLVETIGIFSTNPVPEAPKLILESMDDLYSRYIQDGYEGQIIRLDGTKYEEGKRSKSLIKRKPLYTDGNDIEAKIIDIEEGKGNWQGIAKVAVLEWVQGKNQPVTRATLKGTMDFLREVWKHKNEYKGKLATVTYQNLTPDGYPRFPVVKELDRQF